jgi:hypothetical protein
MLGEQINIPTDILVDMLFVILTSAVLSASDMAEIEQIQRELQRRRENRHWFFATVNWKKPSSLPCSPGQLDGKAAKAERN